MKVFLWAIRHRIVPRFVLEYVMKKQAIEEIEFDLIEHLENNDRMLRLLKKKLVDIC